MTIRRSSMVSVVLAFGALVATSLAGQAGKAHASPAHKVVHSSDLKWTPIMKGCELAAVAGDPSAQGEPFVLRIRCADGTKIPAHWHPTDENLTVLRGIFLVGMGETFDETKLTPMNVGNFTIVPKEMRHFALCKGETTVQVHGAGPFKVNWVNPAEVIPPDAPTGVGAKPTS
jgi:anti-sigma factor ChrR (cupin superfamily)